jgi:hypothetical protein
MHRKKPRVGADKIGFKIYNKPNRKQSELPFLSYLRNPYKLLTLSDFTTLYPMEDSNPELESFRQKWREEVSARSRPEGKKSSSSNAGPSKPSRRPPAAPRLALGRAVKPPEDEEYHVKPQSFQGLDTPSETPTVEHGESSNPKTGSREPRSALEHYEKAVEREAQGSLGDSLTHYRKAFKAGMLLTSQRYTRLTETSS